MDGRGNIYLNGADFDFVAGAPPKPGYIKLVTPDGQLRQVAGDIQFPNGMVITPDNRTLIISESFAGRSPRSTSTPTEGCPTAGSSPKDSAPDGICLDAEGAVWVGTGFSVARVAEGGEVLQRVELAREPGPVRADARRPGPANPVHLHRRMADGRRPRRQPRSADQRASHWRDPDPAGLRIRRRPAMTQVAG